MKINQMIRERRKELGLTQEQIAEALGVSAPAVHKWEKGSTYPDITLLPPLARLLKTDLNTLMSFEEDLSDGEIIVFVDDLDKIVRERSYEEAFQTAIDKIRQYPTCEPLIYSAVIYLEGALALYKVDEPEKYQKEFETFYKRLSGSENQEIRGLANCMLISYARNREDFARAEALINDLPSPAVDKEEQLAVLYRCQKKYDEAEKLWEHRVLKGVTQIQTALMNMMEEAMREEREQDAQYMADLYETVVREFGFPEWMRYNVHLEIALEKQDKEQCLKILKKMLPAMKTTWEPGNCPLYRYAKEKGDSTFLSSRLADRLCDELTENEEGAFLRDCPEFEKLVAEVRKIEG